MVKQVARLAFASLMAAVLFQPVAGLNAQQVAFEVSSVKPSKPGETRRGIGVAPGGRIQSVGMPLRLLIRLAYASDAIQIPEQIVGGPSWVGSDGFDIVAKAEGAFNADADGNPKRLETMLRALLEERFKLKLHPEKRDVPIYALILANRDGRFGPQLHASTAECSVETAASSTPVDPARRCGLRGAPTNMTGQGVTMGQVAASLATSVVVARPVQDRTGLTGKFDLHLESAPTSVQGTSSVAAPIANPAADSNPNLFTAIQEQLGLKLEADKGSVEFLVIDYAERPSQD